MLELINVRKVYKTKAGNTTALNNVSLKFEDSLNDHLFCHYLCDQFHIPPKYHIYDDSYKGISHKT